jgi:hypothetical protein
VGLEAVVCLSVLSCPFHFTSCHLPSAICHLRLTATTGSTVCPPTVCI